MQQMVTKLDSGDPDEIIIITFTEAEFEDLKSGKCDVSNDLTADSLS